MSEEDNTSELTAEVGPGGLKFGGKSKQMAELVAIVSAVGTILVAYMLWTHDASSKDRDKAYSDAIAKLAAAQERTVAATREMTCIISLPQDKREQEFASPFGLCKRVSGSLP